MEGAIFLSRMAGELPQGYDRLYFGSEFCPWTFPGLEEIESARLVARRASMKFTLATPVICESFLPVLKKVLEKILPLLGEEDELLVSDLGTFSLLRRIDFAGRVILGRVLSGQKRGPQILGLELGEEEAQYFRSGSWYGAEAVSLLRELGVGRVELDNLLQGIAPVPKSLCASMHLPYAMVTSSRNCPFRDGDGDGVRGCPARCGEIFTLDAPSSCGVTLLQCGNTQFLRNDRLPENLPALGIDRLVHHPELPR